MSTHGHTVGWCYVGVVNCNPIETVCLQTLAVLVLHFYDSLGQRLRGTRIRRVALTLCLCFESYFMACSVIITHPKTVFGKRLKLKYYWIFLSSFHFVLRTSTGSVDCVHVVAVSLLSNSHTIAFYSLAPACVWILRRTDRN